MKRYIEAIEQGTEQPEIIKEEIKEDRSDDSTTLTTVNSQLDGAKTYKKRIHYCRQNSDNPCENRPCIVEEIVDDVITYTKDPVRPTIQEQTPAEGGKKPQIGN